MFVFTMHIKTKQTLAVCSQLFKNRFKVGRIVKKSSYTVFFLLNIAQKCLSKNP